MNPDFPFLQELRVHRRTSREGRRGGRGGKVGHSAFPLADFAQAAIERRLAVPALAKILVFAFVTVLAARLPLFRDRLSSDDTRAPRVCSRNLLFRGNGRNAGHRFLQAARTPRCVNQPILLPEIFLLSRGLFFFFFCPAPRNFTCIFIFIVYPDSRFLERFSFLLDFYEKF